MNSPALAIAWQLWTRHRRGIVTALATFATMLATSPLLPLAARIILSSIVLAILIAYFMHILLFTDPVGSLESGYPRRMYSLPVPSRTLVGWPMLYGGAVVASLWVTATCLVYRPSGFETPVLIPALGIAAVLIWLQAFAWSPIKNPVLKLAIPLGFVPLLLAVPVLIFWLWGRALVEEAVMQQLAVSSPLVALLGGITQPLVLTLLVTYIVAAYVVARAGIASDRRGDTWQVLPAAFLRSLAASRTMRRRRRRAFRSPAEAQFWYEWDCHGLVIPVACGVLLFLMCGVTFFRHGVGLALPLTSFLIIQVCTAGVLSFRLGSPRPFAAWVRSRAFITFLATRPMSSEAMVAAKLRMTALSLLLMFAIMAVEIALWIVATGSAEEAGELGRLFLSAFPGWRAAAVLVLGTVTLPAFTWGLATAGFPVVLAGRDSVDFGLSLAAIAGGIGFSAAVIGFINHPAFLAQFLTVLPWLVAVATGVKLIVAFLAFRACRRNRLIDVRSMTAIIVAALALAACAIALALLLRESQLLPVPMSAILLGIVFLVPLGRVALAPLALEWNRHR